MNVIVLCLLFPTASGYYWNKITELRDVQLENTINSHRASLEAKGTAVIQSMSLSIHEAVAGFDFSFINILVTQVVAQDDDLKQCMLFDLKGQVFAHNDQALVGSVVLLPGKDKLNHLFIEHFSAATNSSSLVDVIYSQDKTMFVGSAVYNGQKLWGVLRCGYSTQVLKEEIQSTRDHWQNELVSIKNTFITFTLLFFLIAVVFSLLFTDRFVRAIEKLNKGVNQISNGDLTHIIETDGLLVKELGLFANYFNQMTNNLSVSRQKLDEYNQTLEQTVKLRTHELEAINEELSAFSYSVSHDLRAPLRAINGMSTALDEDCSDMLSEEGKRYLERIQKATIKMDELISGMLTLSRAGQTEIKKVEVNLSDAIKNTVASLRREQPDKANNITIEPGLAAVADYKLVNIVIDNLVSNAWKYSSKNDKIEIEIGALAEDKNVFFIRDNGAGFNMEYASKLFIPFQRLHASSDFEGTGIGLATVSRIINRHLGKIWAESEVGKGSTFFFSFTPTDLGASNPD